MKDEKDTKKREQLKSPGASRQELYRSRQAAGGKRQRMVWIDGQAWQAGFSAGETGAQSCPVPSGIDSLSWFSGWIEGEAKRMGVKNTGRCSK